MTYDPTIPAVLRGRNVDAVGWSEARVGDYVLLREPDARADAAVFYITELIDDQTTQLETAFYVNWVGYENQVLDVNFDRENRFHLRRVFSHSIWQVWRDFGVARIDDEPVPPMYSRTSLAALEVLDRLITKHARANGLCQEGMRAFRAEVNEALGWEALKGMRPDVHVTCTIDFRLRDISADDIDVDDIAAGLAAAIRNRTERPGVSMVGGFDGISFEWDTAEVTR